MAEPTQTEVLGRLLEVWRKFPQLRFGQLVDNVISTGPSHRELFYITDEKLMAYLDRFSKDYVQK